MRIADLLRMAFMNLWRRKLRAALTVLGMVIGTASIVVMISLGIGINEAQRQNLEQFGSLTTITVNSYRYAEEAKAGGMMSAPTEVTLDDESVKSFQSIPGVQAVMPVVQIWGMCKSGKYVTDLTLMGIDLSEAEAFGFNLASGRMPESGSAGTVEIVFGSYVLTSFYNPQNYKQAISSTGEPLVNLERSRFELTFDYNNIYNNNSGMIPGEETPNTTPKGKMYKLRPVGTLAEEGNNYAYYSLIDIGVLKKLAKENKDFTGVDTSKYNEVWVKCDDVDSVLSVKESIESMGFGTYSLMDALEMAKESSRQLQLLLGGIGAISLFVAAIGIMNTMMMSIYERTKEIGIIKVLGCRMSNIATLFLAEAAFIGMFGGALGIGLSYGLSLILNMLLVTQSGMMSVIPLYLALFALVFSIFVALVSGMYPAWRAMRLSALAAIRNE